MIFAEPVIRPGGDRFVLVQFGDDAAIELNFLALGLKAALTADRTTGVVDTNPSYNSLIVEYDPDLISHDDLLVELRKLCNALGQVDTLVLESRLAYLPTMYLDPWTKEAIESYCEKVKPREFDPDFVVRLNGLKDRRQLVRVHSGTEHWVISVCSLPGLPLLRPLDPRSLLTSPKYDPPRLWTPPNAICTGGMSTSVHTLRVPGGYNLIGRTPVPMWEATQRMPIFKDSVVLLRAADRVKFVPVDLDEYLDVEARVKEGTYQFNVTEYQRFSVGAYRAWAAKQDPLARF
ncbi:MAG: carboxyltransferase domain-containing protein [Alphaproteobacteria bacterium]|nr:carboxyltransferase domain-containing protein [Alphaproteobacteria bacterium]